MAYCRPVEAIIRYRNGSFPLSASHRSILVCLFTPNGRHTHIVGRYIPAILLECDDFSSFSASHNEHLVRLIAAH